MAEKGSRLDVVGIEEGLLDRVEDTIGGEGSVVIISGGSAAEGRSMLDQVLEQAAGMGCLISVQSCTQCDPRTDRITAALSFFSDSEGGNSSTAVNTKHDNGPREERSYRKEMANLAFLRNLSNANPAILVLEGLESADMATIDMLAFLARNIGGMSALVIATHRCLDEDPIIDDHCDLTDPTLVHNLILQKGAGTFPDDDRAPVRHDGNERGPNVGSKGADFSFDSKVIDHLENSHRLLARGDTAAAVEAAQMALVDATAIDHHGLVLDSLLTMGIALTQAGRDGEALQAYDRAIGLATTFGEMINQRKARLERSELLLFSIGELESASNEAGIADLLSQRSGDLSLRVEPLALAAIIQARNGRPDRAEKIFCEAAIILDKCPLDTLVLERTMLALAAAMMLESRKDLAGMRERYAEAEVLASGTAHPEYWIAVVKMQYGGSLKRQKRPMEARPILEDAAQRFDHLRNPVQSARARRAADVSDTNTSLD